MLEYKNIGNTLFAIDKKLTTNKPFILAFKTTPDGFIKIHPTVLQKLFNSYFHPKTKNK